MKARLRPPGYVAAFLIGALVGTAWDQLQVRAAGLAYAHAIPLVRQPWWIPVEFGLIAVVAVAAVVLLGDPAPRDESSRVAGIEWIWTTGLYAVAAFFYSYPWIVFGVLALALVARGGDALVAAEAHRIPAVIILLIGPVTQIFLAKAGLLVYRHDVLAGIPVWLPLLWANTFLFLVRLAEALLLRFGMRRMVEPATAVLPSSMPEPTPQPDPYGEE